TVPWQPVHAVAPSPAVPGRPEWPPRPGPVTGRTRPRRITVYGAGGPLGVSVLSVTAERDATGNGELELLVTDARPFEELVTAPPQSPTAPRPTEVPAPHRHAQVDVTDPAAVLAAAEGADCLVNCSVVRTDVDL